MHRAPRKNAKTDAWARTARLTFPALSGATANLCASSPTRGAVGGFVKGGRFVEEEASNPADHEATPVAFPTDFQTTLIAPCNRKEAGLQPDGEP
ncbi:hypothetical protein AC244_33535 [Ensifer adhaerens]|uniref:Uncharacterized protein n=1 Tax=Ensifer adhaerens TaxID=106592 RepID=A0A0L8BCZ9_ENSAD|nr:hypothetical protein AC244_33535 [Ensifer adhaerens]